MKHLKIFLSGKMGGLTIEQMNGWRLNISRRFREAAYNCDYKIEVINPVNYYNYENKLQQSEEEVRDFDLKQVTTSDIVVVNLEGLDSSDGSKLEIHEAKYNHKIPVIAFGNQEDYEKLHPWIKQDITRVEPNYGSVVEYIKNFYMI